MGQTISFLNSIFNDIFLTKCLNFFKLSSIVILSSLLVTSCSSQSAKKKVIKEESVPVEQIQQTFTADQKIIIAQEAFQSNSSSHQISQSLSRLTEASQLFLQEQNFIKALWLAEKTLQLAFSQYKDVEVFEVDNTKFKSTKIESTNQSNNYKPNISEILQLHFIKAQSYQALNYNELSFKELDKIALFSQQNTLPLTFEYYQLKSDLLQQKGHVIRSLSASLYAFSLNTQLTVDTAEIASFSLWQKLKMLSPWQIELLAKENAPYLDGWLKLSQYANKFGSDSQQLSRYVQQWQREFPTHPANNIVGKLATQNVNNKTIENIENIAIILPLTGNQHTAGLAAQQGMLAAFEYDNAMSLSSPKSQTKPDTVKSLHFFDSNTLDWTTLPNQFNEQKIDFVVGPLLKSHLHQYLQLDFSLTTKEEQYSIAVQEPESTTVNELKNTHLPTLLLNLPSQPISESNQIAFSMRPEDEATQAAATLSQIGFKKAIVLSHQDKLSQRIAQAFVKQWEKETEQKLDIVPFKQGKEMQQNLKASLDVTTSQVRIDEVKSRLKQTIQEQTRNRRDIDMIYVVGTAEQTRLVKPYIDVNISPFSSLIPMYASSRSHSLKNDSSSNNDLRGLTFTETPWLLNSTSQNKSLARLSAQLWSKRSDGLSRIFAMGFDSYNLIDKLKLMQQAPYVRHYGQTGVLQLNADNILTRSLIWGRYQQKGVSQITLN